MSMTDWRLRLHDKVWTENDVTLGHMALIEEITGEPWPVSPRQSAAHLLAFLAVLMSDGDPAAVNSSFVTVQALTVAEALALFEGDEPPAETTTTAV